MSCMSWWDIFFPRGRKEIRPGRPQFPRRMDAPKQDSKSLAGMGKKFAFSLWFLKNKKYRDRLELILIRSGYPFRWSVRI